MLASSLFLAACGPTAGPTTSGICQALAPAMPIAYHGLSDTPDTIKRIRDANARFAAVCS